MPHLKKKKILFHDDNVPSHTSNIAQEKKHKLGFESLPHLLYSPDQYSMRCESNEEVEWETERYFG